MTGLFHPANAILVIAAVALIHGAQFDLKHYRISNKLNLLLVALFFLHAALSHRWPDTLSNIGLALLMFFACVYFYFQNLMGGGDVKLLTVAFLWAGIDCALAFAILLLLFAALHTAAAKCRWVETHRTEEDKRIRISFAPSVAAALIGIFILVFRL